MRRLRQWLCRGLIGAMLFAQLAVAAYACPGLLPAPGAAASESNAAPAAAPAMDCEHMAMSLDKASPTVCAQHCQQDQQSGQTATLAAPAVLLTSLYLLAPLSTQAPRPSPPRGAQPGLLAATSPPHSILHCCFRD